MKIEMSTSIDCRRRMTAFTLIEVAVAAAIAAMLLAGSFMGFNVAARQVQFSACNLAANTMAMGEIEKYLATSPSQLLAMPAYGTQPTNLCLPVSDSNIVSCTNIYAITNISSTPPYALIQLQCVWNFNGFGTFTNTVVVLRALNL